MPRGGIVKRSARPAAGGGGPAVATPLLAFPNVAAMAAYDTTAFVDGAEGEVATLAGLFLLDKSSALAVTPTTVVNATGGGQWLRQDIASIRWQRRTQFFIAAITGNDEASGLVGAPIRTWAELKRRLGAGPLVNLTIVWLEDTSEAFLYDFVTQPGVLIETVGTLNPAIFTGVISGAVNWNPATSTFGQITAAGLPVSWTASGLVGKTAILTSGVSVGKTFVISADLTAKTARISPPTTYAPPTTGPVANGDTFDVLDLVSIAGAVTIDAGPTGGGGPDGSGMGFGFLDFGASLKIQRGDPIIKASRCHFVDAVGDGQPQLEGCSVVRGRSYQGSDMTLFACSVTEGLEAQSSGRFTLQESLSEGGAGTNGLVLGDLGAVKVLTYFAFYGATTAISAAESCKVDASDAYLFGTGNTTNGIVLGSDSQFVYKQTKLPNILAPATAQMNIGGAIKTYALLPFLNLGNNAQAVPDIAVLAIVDTFDTLVAPTNTAVGATAYAAVLTRNITVDGTRDIVYDVTWGITAIGGTNGTIALFIDGVKVIGGPVFTAVVTILAGSIRWKSDGVASARLAAGAHTITVQWKQIGAAAQMFCRPATEDGENMTLTVRELVRDT